MPPQSSYESEEPKKRKKGKGEKERKKKSHKKHKSARGKRNSSEEKNVELVVTGEDEAQDQSKSEVGLKEKVEFSALLLD